MCKGIFNPNKVFLSFDQDQKGSGVEFRVGSGGKGRLGGRGKA